MSLNLCSLCSRSDSGTCEAFPDGIPVEIFSGGFDHREKFDGDRGVRFAPALDVKSREIEQTLALARILGSGRVTYA